MGGGARRAYRPPSPSPSVLVLPSMVLPCCAIGVVVAFVASLCGSLLNLSISDSIESGITEPHILEMLELSAKGSRATCNKLAEAQCSSSG